MKNIKIQITNFNEKIINFFNKISTYKFKNNKFNKTSNFNKGLIFLISILFLYLFYLSIPSLYDKGKLQKYLSDNLLSEYKINFSISSEINYSILPSPHLLVENAKIYNQDSSLPKELSQIKKLKIYISQKSLINQDKLLIKKIVIQDANFSIDKSDLKFFSNYFDQKFSNKKIIIKDSKFFYKNNNDKIVSIIHLQNSNIFYSKEKFLNIIETKGKIFRVPFNLTWKKNFTDKKDSLTSLEIKKLKLNFTNLSMKKNEVYEAESELKIVNTFSNFRYKIQNNYLAFNSYMDNLKSYNFQYSGGINFNPFDLQAKVIIKKTSLKKITEGLFFIEELLKNELLFNENLSASLAISINEISRNKLFNSGDFFLNFNNGEINLNNSYLLSQKIGLIKLSNSKIELIDGELNFIGDFHFLIDDEKEFYRTFQVPKINRYAIKNIYFTVRYNLFKDNFSIQAFKFDEENLLEIDELQDIFESTNFKINNWIDFKNFTNKILFNYKG